MVIRDRIAIQSLASLVAQVVVALTLCACLTGCVQRRLTVRTNPPGALVYVDNHAIGTTPVSTDFIYYGTREIRLVKDGYETLTVRQPIPAPWYQYVPLDFVAENLWPSEIRDERFLDYQMQPLQPTPPDQLLSRAENLRQSSQTGPVAPRPPAIAPAPTNPTYPLPAPQGFAPPQ